MYHADLILNLLGSIPIPALCKLMCERQWKTARRGIRYSYSRVQMQESGILYLCSTWPIEVASRITRGL